MAYPPKIERALKVLKAAGVPRRHAAPCDCRLLWSCGIPIRPPLFQPLSYSVLVFFGLFPVLYSAAYVLSHWAVRGSLDFDFVSFISGAIGTFIGVGIGMVIREDRRSKYKLPPWSEIDDIASRFD
jgi:hypothetical protein